VSVATCLQDVLYLTRTQAFECPGQLSMRARRVFVQVRGPCPHVYSLDVFYIHIVLLQHQIAPDYAPVPKSATHHLHCLTAIMCHTHRPAWRYPQPYVWRSVRTRARSSLSCARSVRDVRGGKAGGVGGGLLTSRVHVLCICHPYLPPIPATHACTLLVLPRVPS
jgi:hypothetical protein